MTTLLLAPESCVALLTEAERERLRTHFNTGGASVESFPEHWISGHDEGQSYCYECAEKKVAELLALEPLADYRVGGGYGSSGDSTPCCETCQKLLENSLTDYGCESELDHFVENGFDPTSSGDCRAMAEVISSGGWGRADFVSKPDYEKARRADYYASLNALGQQILAMLDAVSGGQGSPSAA